MFGLSLSEIVVIGAVALLVLGPEQIPGLARSIGKMMGELRRAVDEVKYQFTGTPPPYYNPPPPQLIAEPLPAEQEPEKKDA